MKLLHIASGLSIILGLAGGAPAQAPAGLEMGFDVTAPGFSRFGFLDKRNAAAERDCGGQNISPPLQWRGAPADTKSFAIIMYDADGNNGQGETKWIAYNIPPTVHSLPAGAMGGPKPGMTVGLNDHGNADYYGPCPPYGKFHYYHYGVYALDIPVGELPPGMKREDFLKAVLRHVRANQSIVLTYQRTPPPGWTPEQSAPPRGNPAGGAPAAPARAPAGSQTR